MDMGSRDWDGGHLNDPDWWWFIALDGILGAAFTAVLAVAAVLLTLRHERRIADEREAKTVAAQVQGATLALLSWLVLEGEKTGRKVGDISAAEQCVPFAAVVHPGFELGARTSNRWPKFSEMLNSLVDRLVKESSGSNFVGAKLINRNIGAGVSMWIADPAVFEKEGAVEVFMADVPESFEPAKPDSPEKLPVDDVSEPPTP